MSSLADMKASASEEASTGFRVRPHNLEAEQAVLGGILVDNEAFHRAAEFLTAEHFYEPVHARIWTICQQRIERGLLADPVTLKLLFEDDEALKGMEGAKYLAKLARAAEAVVDVGHYAEQIHDLALKRGLIDVGSEVVNRAHDKAEMASGREQIEEAEQKLFRLAEAGAAEGGFRPFTNVITAAVDLVQAAFKKAGRVTGVPTGLQGLDDKLGGLQPSDLLILAGRPSMGKTALAVTIAANSAATPMDEDDEGKLHPVGVFSLEMSAEQLATRLLSAEARIPSDELRRGMLDEDAWKRLVVASQELARRPLYIDDTPALSIQAVRTRARRLKRRFGLSVLVVDYLQLLRGSTSNQANRVQEVSEITQGLKAIAKELNIPVLALSQLSRAVEQREDKRPMLSDLRESGSIEQDADVVMFVFREEYYLSRSEPIQRDGEDRDKYNTRYTEWKDRMEKSANKADVIVAKHRHGSIGTVTLQFDAQYGRFRNPEMIDYSDAPPY
ncbi:MAG TPA: replicative DNA helicase [Geminicoccus sp.]|uniref:replicative DNA helicase n=1 Tax=Geminicoccus sp. TaxID=2024832 RepID=UPI002BD1E450|nr:replicative DNA helicase [Geminicoccus sp.]HWL71253.1 replicative DNA helicase [Geminicoccus sp.]